jgi:hypothetical protein
MVSTPKSVPNIKHKFDLVLLIRIKTNGSQKLCNPAKLGTLPMLVTFSILSAKPMG